MVIYIYGNICITKSYVKHKKNLKINRKLIMWLFKFVHFFNNIFLLSFPEIGLWMYS